MKNTALFVLFVLAVIVVLFLLPRRPVPAIPQDKSHRQVLLEKDCLECHGKDAQNPLSKKHPPKFACFKCHKTKR